MPNVIKRRDNGLEAVIGHNDDVCLSQSSQSLYEDDGSESDLSDQRD